MLKKFYFEAMDVLQEWNPHLIKMAKLLYEAGTTNEKIEIKYYEGIASSTPCAAIQIEIELEVEFELF